jgi:hypothetical protein
MRKRYITLIVFLIVMVVGLTTWGIYDNQYQSELKEKIRDYEVRHYTIASKEIVTRQTDEPYNCFLVAIPNNFWATTLPSLEVYSEAKASTAKSSSGKSSGSRTAPKSTPAPKQPANPNPPTTPRSGKNTKNGNNIDYDQDTAPDDNPTNPIRGRAPSGRYWRCLYRTINRYDYVATDTDSSSYVFASNRPSNTENPDNWNSISVGDPIAKIVEYENYFLAGTDPIFSPLKNQKLDLQDSLIKESDLGGIKSTRINQFYQTAQFFNPQELEQANLDLMKTNSFLNNKDNKKQVNIQLFITPESQEDYIRQICIYRDGCNKNDLILTVSLDDNKNIKRLQGYSWSPTGFDIAIKLDSELTSTPTSLKNNQDIQTLLSRIQSLTADKFVRKEMSEFKYIKEQVERQVQKKY